MRKCPFRDCDRTIADSMFACRGHWFKLSVGHRNAIWDAYNSYIADEITIEELRVRQQLILGDRGVA